MNTVGRPVGTTAEQTRAVVLAAAAEEFGSRGYTRGSIRRIANRANLTSAAIYYHFPTKLACLEAVQGDALEILRAHWDPIMARDGHIAERVGLLLKAGALINRQHPHMARISARAIMEDASGHSEMTGAVQVALAYTEDVYDQLVADAIARGEIAEGIPPQAIRDMISGLMRGLSNIAALEQPIDRYTAAIDALGELFAGRLFTAIGGKAPRPAQRAARSTRAAATKRTAS
jgi:AcrR family transcriptional regulator